MRDLAIVLSVSALSLAAAGCAIEPGGEDDGTAESAATTTNALIPNALIPNALIPNALIPNALIPNALIPNALDPDALTALQDPGEAGDLSRQLIKYVVGCSMPPTRSFAFSWTDTSGVVHQESYPGALGLAPEWADGPLGETGQRIVSACVGARTNYFGVTVLVSIRSSYEAIESQTPASELEAYPYVEGSFWGNLFARTPYLNTCYNTHDISHSREANRDCASGYPEGHDHVIPCGMIAIQGPCSEVCGSFKEADGYYLHCIDRPGSHDDTMTKMVITTALP